MKAIVKLKPERGIWMTDVPIPVVGHNDVLIKISKSAICGTDIHIYKWDEWAQNTIKTPLVIGHEFMGTVVEKGSEVSRVYIGERVTLTVTLVPSISVLVVTLASAAITEPAKAVAINAIISLFIYFSVG